MKLKDIAIYLQYSDRVRVYKDDNEVFCGYWSSFTMGNKGIEHKNDLFIRYKDEEIKKFRCILENRHTKWRKLNLMPPSEPDKAADFVSTTDLEMKLYYTIWI